MSGLYSQKLVFGVWGFDGCVCIAGDSSIGKLEEILCQKIIDGDDINIEGNRYCLFEKREAGKVSILVYALEREIWP